MIKQIVFNSTEELDDRCRELTRQHQKDLLAMRKEEIGHGRPSALSAFLRRALMYYCDEVERLGKIL